MDISWTNTADALQDFANLLGCGKCGCKPVAPIRLTNCGHFFCRNCVQSAMKCMICNVPVQPKEMDHDHVVSSLIQNCDIIAEIIDKRDLWENAVNVSMDNTVSKIIHTPKKQIHIPKNINKTNYKGETALHSACLKRNVEHVKLLLMAGADPNTKDNAGWTPLQEMVNFGHIGICELLLKGGALPDIPGHESRRPLHEATEYDRIEEAKLLLQHNADKDVYDGYGKKPIDYCKTEQMRTILTDGCVSRSSSISDLNQTLLDKSFVAGRDKFVVLASNLKIENQKLLGHVVAKHKLKILNTYRRSVTHVIVEANEQNVTKLTLDVLFAIVRGCWLLNSEWIALAVEMEDLYGMELEVFEVGGAPFFDVPKKARQNAQHQNPRLFNNCFFYFIMQANSAYSVGNLHLTKDDLVKLVKEGDGTVLTREPNPEDLKDMSQVIPFHTANDPFHPLHKCTHYVIYVPGKGEPLIKYKMPHIKSLPLIWLIECIERFTLVNPNHLGLF